jgi:hypothetical protein
MSADLSKLRTSSSQPIYGVLGMDFLERYVMELDLAAGTLRLLDSRLLPQDIHDVSLKINMTNRNPLLKIQSNSVEFWALIDTGALLTCDLERKVYDHLVETRRIMQWSFEVEQNGTKAFKVGEEGWLNELKVGPFTHYMLAVDSDESITLLGLYYWRRYRCTFDFPEKRIYLDKAPLFDVFDDSGHAGVYIDIVDANEKQHVVTYLVKGCWADRNGVRVGDRLIQIDGESVASESIHGIYRRLSFRHNRECALRLVRDGKEFQLKLPVTGKQPVPSRDPEDQK